MTSWYNTKNKWDVPFKRWYLSKAEMEFDDSVNQVKMFTLAKTPSELVVLNYNPSLRNFMHRQGIYQVPYQNAFDDLQGIKTNFMRKISFRDLNWPKGVDFRYSLFNVWAYMNDEVIAYVEFNMEGNLDLITWQASGYKEREYLFDDRGFLSSIRYYTKAEKLWYQDYFNLAGQRQFRQYFDGQGVEIFGQADYDFAKKHYHDMDEVIAEWVENFKQDNLQDTDTLVVTANEAHNDFFVGQVTSKLVLSFFNKRYDLSNPNLKQLVTQANLVVAESHSDASKLRQLKTDTQVVEVTPFDTRLETGKSQQTANLKVLYWVGTQTDEQINQVLESLFILLDEFPKMVLTFASYQNDEKKVAKLVTSYIVNNHLEEKYKFGEESIDPTDVEKLEEQKKAKIRIIRFLEVSSERVLVSELEFTRLIVDLNDEPDLFLQIAGISAGIPQINRVSSVYIEHQKNGLVITDLSDLTKAVEYYLQGLKNWNNAMMHAVNKITNYTSGKLVAKWKELLGE